MNKSARLVISDISDEYRQIFLDFADALELTRGQLLLLLMADGKIIDGGLNTAIADQDAQKDWRDLISRRIFNLANM